ncbi:MAG: peptidylprolyl isomerase [Prosthecobacter sp.]|jgi:cyclophilin family peptidyl-prolyl cis-trans isomerase|uniref:MBG domain-containing protein n=1 Tax=Prosthecobacter sp. TaxID=1965333 RepID=UPI0019EE3A3F|nr:MBG domain-containing protein [Prosthecobacter sp.]MBE2285227.1 peptidylprolyl isomerase [Prosthecobacter sp.]
MACSLSHSLTKVYLAMALVTLALATDTLAVAPAAPTNMTSTYTQADGSTLYWRFEWTDNSTDEGGFTIGYRIFNGASWDQGTLGSFDVNAATKDSTGPLSINVDLSSRFGWYQNPQNGSWFPYPGLQFFVTAFKGTAANPTEPSAPANGPQYSSSPGAQTPTLGAPTNLGVTAGGDGHFHLTWNDNSNSEYYFEVDYKKTTDSTWLATGVDFNLTSQDVGGYKSRTAEADMFLPNFLPGTSYDFKIRAVDFGSSVSAFTSVVTASTQAFKAPTGLTATRVGENTFDLSFSNNSTAESGYHFQYRVQGSSTWLDLGSIDNPYFTIINTGAMPPGTLFEFQARAYIRGTNTASDAPILYTAFSSAASASTNFNAPTNLQATSSSEGRVSLTWTDNSSSEGNYEVQVRLQGDTQWQTYQYLAANTTTLTNQLIAPGKTLEFQVRATYGPEATTTSAFSNMATISPAFNAPTNLVATASTTDPYRISFAWTDNSNVETEYELQYRKQGASSYSTRKVVAGSSGATPNSMTLSNLPEFDPGSIYEFQIRARYSASDGTVISTSAFSSTATTTTKDGFSSKPYAPIKMGVSFSYQLATISQQTRTGWSVGTLPDGLTFDSVTGIISGTPAVAGLFDVPMTANFSGGGSHVLNLALRILRPTLAPVAEVIADQTIAPSGSTSIDLGTKFSDLDTEAAVRMTTTKGDVDMVLYSSLTPGTVANFQSYNYSGTIFHRSPAGFVLQGGGYTIYESPDVFESVSRQSPVANEPGISNVFGTVAMAKVGDDADSATSEFFISLGNNSSNLDNQNGGFTVFGRISSASTAVVNALTSVATGDYAVKLRQDGVTPSSANMVFSDLPIDAATAPTTIDQTKLLKVDSMTSIPVLTYAITAAPDGAIATANLVGTSLQISAVAPGNTSVQVTATDVDGNTTAQTVNIIVPKLAGTVTLESLAQTYNGTARAATATTVPAGLAVTFTYDGSDTVPTNAGSYAVIGTINDPNYQGSASGTLVVAKATAGISLNGLAADYDGNPKPVSVTTTPAGLTVNVTYDGSSTAPSAYGSYLVEASVDDANYLGTQSGTLVIGPQSVASWRTQHFSTGEIGAGLADDDADADGDGIKNLFEYALGRDPRARDAALVPVRDGNGLTLEFTRPRNLPGVTYSAESTDSFGSWSPVTLEVIVDGPVQTVRARDSLSTGNPARRFMRLVVTPVP